MIDNLKLNIRQVMSRRNVSAYALEKRAGLKASAIQNILQGRSKRPGIDVVYAISKELDCKVDDLISPSLKEEGNLANASSEDVWGVKMVESVVKVLLPELRKFHQEIDKATLFLLLEEACRYASKAPQSADSETFVRWLVDKFASAER